MRKLIGSAAVLVFIAPAGFVNGAKAQDTCYANGDVNRDGFVLSVGDMVLLSRILVCEAPAQDSLYQADLNGNCLIDTADLRIYENWHI